MFKNFWHFVGLCIGFFYLFVQTLFDAYVVVFVWNNLIAGRLFDIPSVAVSFIWGILVILHVYLLKRKNEILKTPFDLAVPFLIGVGIILVVCLLKYLGW